MSLTHWALIAFFVIVLVVTAYGGFVIHQSWPISLNTLDQAGVFGDSFGVLTSLFSGLAFTGIIFTVLLQKKELEEQRKELKCTREELANQVNATKHQNFESTFFQMLRLHNEIVNNIDLKSKTMDTTGRDCFVTFYIRLKNLYNKNKNKYPAYSEQELIRESYTSFWEVHQTELGHYFRYLYTILKFIKEDDIEEKRLYTNIVRAQLSDQELSVLFYNCLFKFGVEKFKPLTEEFAIFNNLPSHMLLARDHENFYSHKAFGDA